jgi:hypothetical protein
MPKKITIEEDLKNAKKQQLIIESDYHTESINTGNIILDNIPDFKKTITYFFIATVGIIFLGTNVSFLAWFPFILSLIVIWHIYNTKYFDDLPVYSYMMLGIDMLTILISLSHIHAIVMLLATFIDGYVAYLMRDKTLVIHFEEFKPDIIVFGSVKFVLIFALLILN